MPEKFENSWIHEVRARLAVPLPRLLPPSDARPAAVLVPLYVETGELWTLFVRRSENLRHHRGQIAFPGGSLEPGEEPWQAALREAHEEVALEPRQVLPLGQLDEAETPTGFRIVPCVGAIPVKLEVTPDRSEIEEVFTVPIRVLANPQIVEEKLVTLGGSERWIRIYHFGSRQIWGLTARILQNLLHRLGLAEED